MDFKQKLYTIIIYSEFSLIFLIVISSYFVKLVYFFQNRKHKIIFSSAEKYIIGTIDDPINSVSHFQNKFKNIRILLDISNHFDGASLNGWQLYKKQLFKHILLPLARQQATSNYWVKRLMSVKVFVQYVEPVDEDIVCQLINDPVPIVYITSLKISKNLMTEKIINIIITRMGKERKKSHFFSLEAFINSPSDASKIINQRLNHEKDPYTRMACYELLIVIPYSKNDYGEISPSHVYEDIESSFLDLSLAAIRYMSHVEKTDAIPKLIELLKNSDWRKRVVAIQEIKKLHSEKALSELRICLNDSERWVRLNAASAIYAMGDPGIKLLSEVSQKDDPIAFEAARYVLGNYN